ncbi:pyrroloquinoline quinone-dependent dehydrogenase [Lutimonas sp.]|uniref:pyrroloquinoline quinone-dependent dehydrogenase n=1 Tax=Lutimonas sp. TaxID=1872403 RepID=UPI003D9B8C81
MSKQLNFIFIMFLLLFTSCRPDHAADDVNVDWPVYLGGNDSNQFSSLDQINKGNVQQLKVAWTYNSGKADPNNRSQIQCNPIIIDNVLYGTSPELRLFALHAGTGELIWEFDPNVNEAFSMHVNRGVTYWENANDKRLFMTAGSNLYAIDALTGQMIRSFGDNGIVSLKEGLDNRSQDSYVVSKTPGIVYENKLIIGSVVSETMGAASGHIRAFNVLTGAMEWIFHTIPLPGEYGYDTWPKEAYTYAGGANNWSGMSLDPKKGIVYCPTGSAAYDFWGGDREGENLFANSLLALDANTGERIWHFQTVHHDILDKDLPAPPNLIQVEREGQKIDAVAQITKQGFIFLFDRVSGEPLFPVDEIPVPSSDLKGELSWPTQPVPQLPKPIVPQVFDQELVTNIDSTSHTYVSNILKTLRTGEPFTPPSTQGTVIFPGFDGGSEWGGVAADASAGIIYVNSNIMPWIHMMVPLEANPNENTVAGRRSYLKNCAVCHGQQQEGDPSGTFPSLQGIQEKYSKEEMMKIVQTGKGFMPSFSHLPTTDLESILAYIREDRLVEVHIPDSPDTKTHEAPFTHTGYNRFFDDKGYPAVKPPWGTLTAVDMNKGELIWQVPLGEYEELTAAGISKTGTENYGGPVLTAGGVIFIAASKDEYFRVFDKDNGAELWKYKLPAGGYATPSTYMVGSKQFVVIACGGGKMGTPSGANYIAFALE